jgi:hypothetical protein
MQKANVKTHTAKDAVWTNASGDQVPVKFLTHADKIKEAESARVRKAALSVEKSLADLHAMMSKVNAAVTVAIREEYELKKGAKKKDGKGNMTWYNFDGSIKVEVNINDIVKWDDSLMNEAQKLFNEYINTALDDKVLLVKKLINDAFSNRKGSVDSRMAFQILKYEGQMKSLKYDKACELMRNAQRIDKTRLYMMVWEKMEDGSYRNINLNFSSL